MAATYNFAGINDDPLLANNEHTKNVQGHPVHIRIQQRNGRKTLTTVQGLDAKYDFKKIVKYAKKEFSCNGTIVQHPEYGEIIQLQGDQRVNLHEFICRMGLASKEVVKVHGF